MNELLRKELRLLLPAWLAAMGMCVLPFLSTALNGFASDWREHLEFTVYAVPVACAVVGISVFGREFSGGAFSLLLAQPCPRREFWNAKLWVLGGAVLTLLLTAGITSLPFLPWREGKMWLGLWTLSALAAASGALWLTLLLRQLLAAFWLSLLLPLAPTLLISTAVDATRREWWIAAVLLLYSLVSFLAARKLFLHAQDVAWTGGAVTLPALWHRRTNQSPAARRRAHPTVALLSKEFQLQQVTMMLAALLFVVNIAVLGFQKVATVERDSLWNIAFEGFSLLWFLMPLMIGCAAVAEERRLATLESQLCLPVSRVRQFLMKVASVGLFALLLGALPMGLIHVLKSAFGLPVGGLLVGVDNVSLALGCVLITLIALYASTLSRHFLQALAITIALGTAVVFLSHWLLIRPPTIGGYTLWEGSIGLPAAGAVSLVFAFGLLAWRGRPATRCFLLSGWLLLLFTGTALVQASRPYVFAILSLMLGALFLLLAISFRNFRHVRSGASLWRSNLLVWSAGYLLTAALATACYHRVWELALRFEPPAGAARLSGKVRPVIAADARSGWLLALLPDGRLWTLRESETEPYVGEWTGKEWGWKITKIHHPHAEFLGSNWVDLALSQYDGAGVKGDGSLWRISWWETEGANAWVPAGAGNWVLKGHKLRQTPMTLTRLSEVADWAMVAAGTTHFLALKRDGTLWGWGENRYQQLGDGLPESVDAPVQLGPDNDWDFIAAFPSGSLAVKRDLSVWKWGRAYPITSHGVVKGYIRGQPQKIATLPAKPELILSESYSDVFACADGTGWGLGYLRENCLGADNQSTKITELQKLWEGGKWTVLDSEYSIRTLAIRKDGSLWRQGTVHARRPSNSYPMTRIGARQDWIAVRVRSYDDTTYALARDGRLCRFGGGSYLSPELIMPTSRVTWSVNVLDSVK